MIPQETPLEKGEEDGEKAGGLDQKEEEKETKEPEDKLVSRHARRGSTKKVNELKSEVDKLRLEIIVLKEKLARSENDKHHEKEQAEANQALLFQKVSF